jgi:hypothetical protein
MNPQPQPTPDLGSTARPYTRNRPNLPRAACVGHPELFDVTDEALAGDALAVCQRCRELPRCRAWLDSLPRKQWPSGVVAGEVRRPT